METENEIREIMANMEVMERKKFLQSVEPHFNIAYDGKDIKMIRFVADKCFAIGFRRGVIALMDMFESYKTKKGINGSE